MHICISRGQLACRRERRDNQLVRTALDRQIEEDDTHAAVRALYPSQMLSSRHRALTGKSKLAVDVLPRMPARDRAAACGLAREGLFGCLAHDPPDSDSELSLTDLVEDYERAAYSLAAMNETADQTALETPSRRFECPHGAAVPAAAKGTGKKTLRRTSNTGSGRGILLNVYVPTTLTQSPSVGRRSRGGSCDQHGRAKTGESNHHHVHHSRDHEPSLGGCWSVLILQKRKEKVFMGS